MPSFSPFPGLRFASGLDPADVTAPPYDVIDPSDRAALASRSDRNVVHIDLPDEAHGDGRYRAAARTLEEWIDDGSLVVDPAPTFTVYRMRYRDDRGRDARTLGVIGALELSRPDEGSILPHEHTTRKAKTDRLDLLRATGTNLSPIWVLSLTDGLTALIEPDGPPEAEWTDGEGVGHAVWTVADPVQVAAIAEAVARTPVVVADGHHRYETALQHREEQRPAAGDGVELGADATMALVVELTADELCVRPIHRLVGGANPTQLTEALVAGGFERVEGPDGVVPADAVADGSVLDATERIGAVAVVDRDGTAVLLRPRADAFEGVDDLDSARIAAALDGVDGLEVRFQHGVDLVARAVAAGEADAGILLRPATVAQIEDNAHAGRRMPAKTTFFHPKPRTGVVFRRC